MATHRATVLTFLIALLPGLCLAATLRFAAERRAHDVFVRYAELTVDRIETRLHQHVVALRASRGLWEAREGQVTREEFVRFIRSVDLVSELSGARAVGFAPMIAPDDMAQVQDAIHSNYDVTPRPELPTDQPWRTPVLFAEPSGPSTLPALGYDMFSDPVRRAAMQAAIDTGEPQASAPVTLVGPSNTDGDRGFVIFLPLSYPASLSDGREAPVSGFVFVAFFAQDLITAALEVGPSLPVTLNIVDAEDRTSSLYTGPPGLGRQRIEIRKSIFGRDWLFDVRQTGIEPVNVRYGETVLVLILSVLFAAAVSAAISSRQKEAANARELADAAGREAEYRTLLLHEMKHRIKNHIARIQSISRQSARGATDVKDFTQKFEKRLGAMASVQEILAGSAQPHADVAAILRKELQQVLDRQEVEDLIEGPAVRLDERQSHAFGLVVHELVTNAIKYGGLSADGTGLKVRWSVAFPGGTEPRTVRVEWQERFQQSGEPSPAEGGSGFGSRLIEASITGELSGSFERKFHDAGLDICITFPVLKTPGSAAPSDMIAFKDSTITERPATGEAGAGRS